MSHDLITWSHCANVIFYSWQLVHSLVSKNFTNSEEGIKVERVGHIKWRLGAPCRLQVSFTTALYQATEEVVELRVFLERFFALTISADHAAQSFLGLFRRLYFFLDGDHFDLKR